MGKGIGRFLKKNKPEPIQPFAITVIVNPATGHIGWMPVAFGNIPYPLMYKALESCRDALKLAEANQQAREQGIAEAKKMDQKEKL